MVVSAIWRITKTRRCSVLTTIRYCFVAFLVTVGLHQADAAGQCSYSITDEYSNCGGGKSYDDCCYGSGGGLFGMGLLGGPGDGREPLSAWVWAAPTFGSGGPYEVFGFSEGVNVGYRMTDAIGLYGSIGFNHQAANSLMDANTTQILGTIGVQKFGNPDGAGLLERTSLWALWDQSAFLVVDDPMLYGAYQHQIRILAGYATGYHSEIGAAWSIPIGDDVVGAGFLSTLGGPGYLTSSEFIGAYVKRQVGATDLTGTIGFAGTGSTGATVLGVGAERPISDRVNVYADFKAGEGGSYAGSVGMAVSLGAADTKWY